MGNSLAFPAALKTAPQEMAAPVAQTPAAAGEEPAQPEAQVQARLRPL
jgi:hypothetical protein